MLKLIDSAKLTETQRLYRGLSLSFGFLSSLMMVALYSPVFGACMFVQVALTVLLNYRMGPVIYLSLLGIPYLFSRALPRFSINIERSLPLGLSLLIFAIVLCYLVSTFRYLTLVGDLVLKKLSEDEIKNPMLKSEIPQDREAVRFVILLLPGFLLYGVLIFFLKGLGKGLDHPVEQKLFGIIALIALLFFFCGNTFLNLAFHLKNRLGRKPGTAAVVYAKMLLLNEVWKDSWKYQRSIWLKVSKARSKKNRVMERRTIDPSQHRTFIMTKRRRA